MRKPDLDAFDRGQIVGTQSMGHSIYEITPRTPPLCAPLALSNRRLRCIVRSQRCQTLAQITTQFNDDMPVVQSLNGLCSARFPYGFREPSTYESTIA
ncbi:hypothetical protein TNCV_3273001 [Trichonephila clavipes]|nr:hypothetical protein TNCV_3273001 [Trichonephila clavipes]